MNSFRNGLDQSKETLITGVATIGTCFTYLVTRALMAFAPEVKYREDRSSINENDLPSHINNPHGDKIITLSIFLYKRSLIHRYLHRNYDTRCVYIPSCSDYAMLAVRKYGLARGLILIGGRFRRCGQTDHGDYVDFP